MQGLVRGLLTFLPHRPMRGRGWRLNGGWREIRTERHDDNEQINHTGGDAERLLARYHIPIFGRRVRHREFIFSVPARQAAWAEYVLLRGGITLAASHRLIDQRNVRYAQRHSAPIPAWADGKHSAPPAAPERPRRGWFDL